MKNKPQFSAAIKDDTVEISLQQKRALLRKIENIPLREWATTIAEEDMPALTTLHQLMEDFDGQSRDDIVVLPHYAVTGLTDIQASALGLPPSIPFAFDIKANGMIDQPNFKLTTSWVNAGGVREFGVANKGAFAIKGDVYYRIPSPIFEIVKAAEILANDNPKDQNERYKSIALLQEIMSAETGDKKILPDSYLGSIRVLHASAFSLQIPMGNDGFQFNPVLFSRRAVGRAQDDGRILDEAENLLTESLQSTFTNARFRKWSEARDCYAVDQGVYVYIDKDLKKALSVVRSMQDSSIEVRKNFIRNPQLYLREKLGDEYPEEAVGRLFVETEQYADNVKGLGLWEPPVLPWIIKEPNSWLPEKFGLKIGDIYVQVDPADVTDLRTQVQQAQASGTSAIDYKGHQIPVTPQVVDVLEKLCGIASPIAQPTPDPVPPTPDIVPDNLLHFLVVEDNFESLQYQAALKRRSATANYSLPAVLKTSLKPHQTVGLKWLIDSWSEGMPGVLLADDMGLGKTLQALTFLAWIKERKLERNPLCKEPVLIIAPTGLLRNWQREIEIHLHSPGLGSLCFVYGAGLAEIRAANQNDLKTGQVNLNRDRIRQSDVVLTTYETYRDYHHSFGGIRFSATILDECQKIKNPKSQVNRALASMNTHFLVAMTGTPVENAIEDIWTIMDRAWPGYLGDLKQFSATYSPDDQQALLGLTQRLKSPAQEGVTVPVLFRRMKDEILDGLPKKIIHREPLDMPRKQADAYLEVINQAKGNNPPPMLNTLHALRGISLHPITPDLIIGDPNFKNYDSYISDSARLTKAFQILDSIKNKNEKALVFIESLDMQSLVADIVRIRYGLPKRPSVINGKTGVDKIQKAVDNFQQDTTFDVMILSPKVGGVGLTLTAANHVIHLSRWWNPAVEDQSTDRVYRIGQKKEVHVYYPIALHPDSHMRDHSFDLKLDALLERKRKLSRDMLLPAESSQDAAGLFSETVGFENPNQQITIEDLDDMEPKAFELWVLTKARQAGYQTDATLASWDKGADGIIVNAKTRQKFIIQCKHCSGDKYSNEKVIEDLLRARAAYDVEGVAGLVALTNSRFSETLVKRMQHLQIKFFDRNSILNWPRL